MTDLEYHEIRMREERAACEKLRKKEQRDKISSELRSVFQSLVDAGFSEEQAWELFKGMCKAAWTNS